MDALEICISRIVSCLNERLKACLHKCAYTAAKNSLLTEEVCLCLNSECRLKKSCSCSADSKAICKCKVLCLSCVVLLNSDKTRCSLSCLILAANRVSGSLRCDHCYVDVLRRNDLSEMNCKTVSEHKHVAIFKVRLDIFFIHCSLLLIVDKNHDDVCLLCSLCCRIYLKSLRFSLCPRLTSLVKTDANIQP